MKISSIILISAMAIVPAAFAQNAPPPNSMNAVNSERHPEMMKALHELRAAKRNLEHGAHDFHGHRAAALQHTDAAIHEVEVALKSDKQ